MDFTSELQKLLTLEESPPFDTFTELAQAQMTFFECIQKNDSNISLQVEEIYDIIKDYDDNAKEVKTAVKRENILVSGLVSLGDLLDTLVPYVQGHDQALTVKKDDILNACGVELLGFVGEQLDPRLHTVASAVFSEAMIESVIDVLEYGYVYRGKVIRKATVILSKGAENV